MKRTMAVGVVVGLALVALIWLYQSNQGTPGEAGAPKVAPTRGGEAQTPPPAPTSSVPRVDLRRLDAPRRQPEKTRRNPFRFEGARQASGAPSPSSPLPTAGPGMIPRPSQPPTPIGPPPIPLKFIGIVEAAQRGAKVAVLSDGRDVFYGREGDVVDGRYRIVRIGVESIELEYLDGRGRQTIRLNG
ncbi:MAG: hypothetical protein HYZ58_15930 [Acidobacteria bacterium]|nr:hypothetical protein [Acidobacteriota bacterium]